MRCRSRFIWSRVNASSAPNGSSISTISGSWTSARQSATRCFIPPESSNGSLLSKPPSPTRPRRALAAPRQIRGPAGGALRSEQDVVQRRAPFQQLRRLEYDAAVGERRADPLSCDPRFAGVGGGQADHDHHQRRLAEPLGPRIETNSPLPMPKDTSRSALHCVVAGRKHLRKPSTARSAEHRPRALACDALVSRCCRRGRRTAFASPRASA